MGLFSKKKSADYYNDQHQHYMNKAFDHYKKKEFEQGNLMKKEAYKNLFLSWVSPKRGELLFEFTISVASDSCEHCKKLDGKKYTAKQAHKIQPLPCPECTHEKGYCRCDYISRPMRDKDGFAMTK